MNNKEFIAELATRNGMKSVEAERLVNTLISAMCDTFIEGDAVQLSGFGTFEVRKKMERVIVNPKTAQRMLVPPKLTVVFKPVSSTKERVKKGGNGNG